MKYRAEIDGLRALAVIPVLLFHAGVEPFGGGYVGVDVFFVISGYLITTLILQDLQAGKFSLINFYERRARRILPALYIVIVVTGIVSIFILPPDDLQRLAKSIASIPLFLSNLFFWSERGYFGLAAELKPLIHTWSLAVEEQFYIVFPLFLLFINKYRPNLIPLFIIIIFSISLVASWYISKLHFETAFFLPFTRAWELALGSFLSILFLNNRVIENKWAGDSISLLGLIMIAYSVIQFDSNLMYPYLYALLPTVGTAMVIYGTHSGQILRHVLSLKIIVFVGLISYSLYLIHQPVFALSRHLNVFDSNKYILLLVVFPLAILSFFIERFFRCKRNFSQKFILKSAIISSLVIVAGAVIIILFDGFPQRYNVADQKILLQFNNFKSYNQALFNSLKFATFEEKQKKILLTGDSYAKDFLNVVNEAGLFKNLSFSTRQINSACGNLYLSDYSIIQSHIPEKERTRCKLMGRYEGQFFRELARDADEIWLVNSWLEWVFPYLHDSIARLERDFDVRVRVFGIKHFGNISKKDLISIPVSKRSKFRHSLSDSRIKLDRKMEKVFYGMLYYHPLLSLMCGGDVYACKIFDDEGYVISPDGGHLSRRGAKEVAQRIKNTLFEITR